MFSIIGLRRSSSNCLYKLAHEEGVHRPRPAVVAPLLRLPFAFTNAPLVFFEDKVSLQEQSEWMPQSAGNLAGRRSGIRHTFVAEFRA